MSGNPWLQSHYLATGIEWAESDHQHWAHCSCGWRSSSASGALSRWNVEGHKSDVEAARKAAPLPGGN